MKQTVNWHNFWTQDKPGFHEGEVNAYLKKYLPLFNLQPGNTIFMPLCGKAVDILWLAQQGYPVIGVELSSVAIESFFEESSLTPQVQQIDKFTVYSAQNITLYQGDYMDVQASELSSCKLVYDRASIVAIESFNRSSYVEHMFQLIPPAIPALLITLEYNQSQMQGPPFSVPVSEIQQLYQSRYEIELLESNEQIHERPKWREKGLESLLETAMRLTPR